MAHGVNLTYEVIPPQLKVQVLREYVLFKRHPYHWAITISPPLMDAKQFVKEIAYVRHLFGKKYMFVVESDKGRLHVHGLFPVKKHDYELMKQYEELITRLVGFAKVKCIQRTENAVLGWLRYMFKDQDFDDPLYIDQHTESLPLLQDRIETYLAKQKAFKAKRKAEEEAGINTEGAERPTFPM